MNWKLKLLPAGLLAVLGTLASTQPAAAWDVVGQREVFSGRTWNGTSANAVIRVAGRRQYRQIKLCVYGNPVHFRDLRINFHNGGHQDVTIRSQINAGECTRVIDLEGGARNIMNISAYDEQEDIGDDELWRATVRVYAQ